MKRLLALLFLVPLLASGANIDFRNLNTNHFTTNGYRVSLKNIPTNQTLPTFVTQVVSSLTTSGGVSLLQVSNVIDTQLTNGNIVYVDQRVGSDILARRWSFNWPALTPIGGKNTATNGDTVYVRPGIYTNSVTNLFKNRVDWHFLHAELQYIDPTTNGPGAGHFDDRFSGAVTSRISGTVTLRYSSGTNGYYGDLCELYFGNYLNGKGAIVITNANTLVSWEANTKIFVYGTTATPYGLFVENCKEGCFFNIDEIANGSPYIGSNHFVRTDCPADPGTPYTVDTICSGISWGLGSFQVNFKRIWPMTLYALNFYGTATNDVADLYMNGELCEGKIYGIGLSRAYRTWINIAQIRTTNAGAYEIHGSGTHYLTSQKVSEGGSSVAIATANNGANPSNQVIHLNVEKVASHEGAWIDSSCGVLRGYVGHFETSTNVLSAGIIARTNGVIDLSGQFMSNALYCVNHIGGYTRLEGYRMISTNNAPVFLNGPGFIGQNVVMIGRTNCVVATNAQTMKIYNGAASNTNEHPNVAITTGTLTVNGGVQ